MIQALKKNKKHIVLISAHFYPIDHIAAYRMNGFVKYLDHSQFDISVITINSDKKTSRERILWIKCAVCSLQQCFTYEKAHTIYA